MINNVEMYALIFSSLEKTDGMRMTETATEQKG
jgi:hypothetical protein